MMDIVGNELNVGDHVVFSYCRESVAIGQITKLCSKKVRIKHYLVHARKYDREETIRYPHQVVKYMEVKHE